MLSLFSAVALVATAMSPSSPLFIWEGSNGLLRSRNVELTDALTTSSVVDLIKFSVGSTSEPPSSLVAHLNTVPVVPEIVVVFVQPQLLTSQVSTLSAAFQRKSEGGLFKNLKELVTGSPSSLTAPYVYNLANTHLLTQLRAIDGAHFVDALDAPAFLADNEWMFRDNAVNVVVIEFNENASEDMQTKLRKDDNLVGQVLRKVNTLSHGKYMALYTANTALSTKSTKSNSLFETAEFMMSMKAISKAEESTSSNTHLYITPAILAGLLVSLLLICVSSCGVSGLMYLETPDQFEREGGYLAGQ